VGAAAVKETAAVAKEKEVIARAHEAKAPPNIENMLGTYTVDTGVYPEATIAFCNGKIVISKSIGGTSDPMDEDDFVTSDGKLHWLPHAVTGTFSRGNRDRGAIIEWDSNKIFTKIQSPLNDILGTYTVEHADYTEATIAKNSDGMIVVSKTKAAGEISSPSSEAMDEGVFITRDGDDIILHWKPWEVTGIFSRRGTDNTGKFTITWGKKIFTKIQEATCVSSDAAAVVGAAAVKENAAAAKEKEVAAAMKKAAAAAQEKEVAAARKKAAAAKEKEVAAAQEKEVAAAK